MTVDNSMSSGYCSLDEDLEDCFFTAKTTFFRSPQGKCAAKVNRLCGSPLSTVNLSSVKGLRSCLSRMSGCQNWSVGIYFTTVNMHERSAKLQWYLKLIHLLFPIFSTADSFLYSTTCLTRTPVCYFVDVGAVLVKSCSYSFHITFLSI